MIQQTTVTTPDTARVRANADSSIAAALGEFALLTLCTLPGMVFSYQTIQEPWTLFRIARASMSLNAQHILTYATSGASYRSEHIGGEMLQVLLLAATQLPLEAVSLLPVGSLLLAILFYAAARTISTSKWTAVAIAIFASWYYPGLYSQFGTETYAWTHSLFIVFLILHILWMRKRNAVLSTLIMIIFTSTFLHYHTTPLWIVVAISITILAHRYFLSKQTNNQNFSWSIALFCFVVYFSFDTVVYGNGLARLRSEATSESFIQSFLSKIVGPLLAQSPELRPFEIAVINPRLATWSTLAALLLLTIPVGLWCLRKMQIATSTRQIRSLIQNQDDVFVWSVIGVALAHMAIYSTYGAVSIRVIPLAFPLLLPIVTRAFLPSKKWEVILPACLAGCAVAGFFSIAPTLRPDTTASETGLVSNLIIPDSTVLADANVYGSLLLKTAERDQLLDFAWIDSEIYSSVVGMSTIDWNNFDYLVVDMSGKPIISSSWAFYEPWSQNLPKIENNEQLDKIYDSENVILFQRSGADLPQVENLSLDDDSSANNPLNKYLQLLFTVSLLILPGAVIVSVLHNTASFQKLSWHVQLGLSIGLSITLITFIGYVVNFTPLGLGMLIPLVVTTSVIVMLGHLLLNRHRLRVSFDSVVRMVSILAVAVVWSVLAIQVTEARTQRHAEYTEFFATQSTSGAGSIDLHIVNRHKRPIVYEVVINQQGKIPQNIGTLHVDSRSKGLMTWSIPEHLVGQSVEILLMRDGQPDRKLILRDTSRF